MTTNMTPQTEKGELFSMLVRLHPIEVGQVSPSSGNQLQAAFLDMVRQGDPALATWLHTPNQRRPYTLSLLQGFNHLSEAQRIEATYKHREVEVRPGQVYWLRITMLDSTVFHSFVQYMVTHPRALKVHIGNADFEISRLITTPDPHVGTSTWVASSSFAELHTLEPAEKRYLFEFASPTTFSKGQKPWGKLLKLFPEPADVFESLARQWESFAPTPLRLSSYNLTPQDITAWCAENIIVTNYKLETRYLPSQKFGQTGFFGTITYEVKGSIVASEARWLTPLARFALFAGIGYKTTMGMGQTRCIINSKDTALQDNDKEKKSNV
jgi:CRISPR-associated endoribonuclease Cas6